MQQFRLLQQDGAARRGELHTAHGVVQTPAFMPVGTAATVKAMTPQMVEQAGAEILLGNTYHLMLRPGAERVARLGGLHHFMGWNKPILTDSGGFQVMSLSGLRKITEEGVTFASHLDGSKHHLTPERAVEIQHLLGSDITMVLDECPPFPIEKDKAASSMQLSMRWAQRCRDSFIDREGYGLFGIVQGSVFADLRQESAAALQRIGFDGYAIGGLAVGEGQELMFRVLDEVMPAMPQDKPRYLMGVGKPDDILGAVLRGVDMFDCVLPTRSGRNAQAFTSAGTLNLLNARYAEDKTPIDAACGCYTCQQFGRAYLHHLFKAREMLGGMLLTLHNVFYYQELMRSLRAVIAAGNLAEHATRLRDNWKTAATKDGSGD
jgi:queuine tRNA-ribosyltransferase